MAIFFPTVQISSKSFLVFPITNYNCIFSRTFISLMSVSQLWVSLWKRPYLSCWLSFLQSTVSCLTHKRSSINNAEGEICWQQCYMVSIITPHSIDDKTEAQSIKEFSKVIFKARNGTEMKTEILRLSIQDPYYPSQWCHCDFPQLMPERSPSRK